MWSNSDSCKAKPKGLPFRRGQAYSYTQKGVAIILFWECNLYHLSRKGVILKGLNMEIQMNVDSTLNVTVHRNKLFRFSQWFPNVFQSIPPLLSEKTSAPPPPTIPAFLVKLIVLVTLYYKDAFVSEIREKREILLQIKQFDFLSAREY